MKTLECLKRLYTSYFIIIVYVDWSRINKWKKLNWKIQCKQKLKIQAPIFSSGENVAIAMIVIRQKGKSRFSECFLSNDFCNQLNFTKLEKDILVDLWKSFVDMLWYLCGYLACVWLGNCLRTSFPIICPWKSIQNQQNFKNRNYKL